MTEASIRGQINKDREKLGLDSLTPFTENKGGLGFLKYVYQQTAEVSSSLLSSTVAESIFLRVPRTLTSHVRVSDAWSNAVGTFLEKKRKIGCGAKPLTFDFLTVLFDLGRLTLNVGRSDIKLFASGLDRRQIILPHFRRLPNAGPTC